MKRIIPLMVCLSMFAVARADFTTGFEAPTYTGSPGGTVMSGQDGWYNPVAGSADYKVYTYAGNTYGVVPNPGGGGDQFAAGRMEGNLAFARAQHDHDWTTRDVWYVQYDVNALYTGTVPAVDNLGSFSMQPSGTATYFQSLYRWMDPNNPVAWKSDYVTQENPSSTPWSPGAAWQSLAVNHWYAEGIFFRLSDKLILEVSITDLTTGITTTVSNPGKHLVNLAGTPTAFRFFTGGGAGTSPAGNFVAWDNLKIVPEPGSLALIMVGLAALTTRRWR